MMGLSVADARSMSLWEYEALLVTWNERHRSDDDDEVEVVDYDTMRAGLLAVMRPEYMN